MSAGSPGVVRHYYVDEAGDLTLFDAKGRVIVGNEGVSRAFMVGVAHVPDPAHASAALDALRRSLLDDPYFRGVPSMRPGAGKTARAFHAKDDVAEVRREVFRLLPSLGAKVQVVVRRKDALVAQARMMHDRLGRKLSADEVYDSLSSRLLKNLLHKADENRIVFARRGKSDRADALERTIVRAKRNFSRRWGIPSDRPTLIRSAFPHEEAGLQVVDYYLWALQRLYERNEDRYFNLLRDGYRLVMDIDDTRRRAYGEWYSVANPLTLEKRKPLTG
ncbi:MAG: DUF3800 domain-containing protein [Phycisphaerales bacterium]|nr:DUF3800 domain-containing protein [Phycisphaerales bacterium]